MNRNTKTLSAMLAVAALLSGGAVYGETPRSDPFAAAAAAEKMAAGSNTANPFRPSAGAAPASASPAAATEKSPRRVECDRELLEARRALSVGDVARAQTHLGQAQQMGVAYVGPGDSPQDVAEAIRQCQELAELRKSDGGGAGWRQAYSKFLVAQADALVSWNDLDGGGRAANEAAQLNPQFGPGGLTPQSVLIRIQKLRNGQTAAQAPVGATPPSPADAKQKAAELMSQARGALRVGDLPTAEVLAGQASALGVADSQFGPQEDNPSRLAADLERARGEAQAVQLAENQENSLRSTATPGAPDFETAAAEAELNAPVETPVGEPMRLSQLPEVTPLPPEGGAGLTSPPGGAFDLLENGEKALRAGDRASALESFRAAYKTREQLDVLSQQRLQGHLQMLSAPEATAKARREQPADEQLPAPEGELLDSAADGRSVVARQLSADVGKRQSEAQKLLPTKPNEALTMLREARALVDDSELDADLKKQLTSRIDSSLRQSEKYIKDHKADLDLDAANQAILDEIDRERAVKVEVSQKMAEMVDQFNKLVDEQRFSEAEVVANRLYEMAPDELVAQQVNKQAKMIRREQWSRDINAQSENGVANVMLDARHVTADALDKMNTDFAYGDSWDKVKSRKAIETGKSRNIKELEIEQKLRTQVLPRYDATPLTKVVEGLSQLAGVNIHLDPRGLTQEGVDPSTPVTLNLPQEISLKSALTLILEPLHLTYTVKDEVLKITSEQIRDGERYIETYPVGDLVIPIPNFVPNNNIGLQGLINDAYAAMGGGGAGVPGPMTVVAGNKPGGGVGVMPPNAMAQQFGGGGPSFGGGAPQAGANGPGGLGGAANADFDSLIDLIVNTVEHDTWMENGTGEGEIQPFPTNLSLVISQTQRVHEQVADLLEQLRRLQDLQVTIEVRFIRLTDRFFERIGVDFDFNIEDRTGPPPGNPPLYVDTANGPVAQPFEPNRNSLTVGMNSFDQSPNYTVDLDLPFRQGSFGLTAPQFGAFDANSVGSFGFAILSDIEAFFVVNAGQGDQRANVLQAPKVTLFNGQSAIVIDSAFVPFVISVIPVVGEFAAAQQPVIVVLSEGTMMTVQAVVSDDRRYVRLTLVPFFSQIGDVRTFTFEGSETRSTSSSSTDDGDENTSEDEAEEITRSGTTVQLPTFEVISVATTVSVPDGGTVLLGGIKRLREGRNELGIPLLSKIAYVDRLFRNVGIGRDTDSLMMMVTPHIIIQEEEEERLGIAQE